MEVVHLLLLQMNDIMTSNIISIIVREGHVAYCSVNICHIIHNAGQALSA
jgi:hypothetical protein